MKRHVRLLTPITLMFVIVTAVYAGGWATVTLKDLPDYAVAGEPLALKFSIRQHGMQLLGGLKPSVRAVSGTGTRVTSAVAAAPAKGEYTASLIMPQAGNWRITISNGFDSTPVELPTLKVIPAGDPAPARFADGTRGGRLFVAKGCVGCHRHQEINPARASSPAMDLTGRRFPEDYLKRFLADPGIKPAEMPDLDLEDSEITALVAFMNKTSQKQLR